MLTTSQLFIILFIPAFGIWINIWNSHRLMMKIIDLEKEIRRLQDYATT